MTWPIGMGRDLKGVYHLNRDFIHIYNHSRDNRINTGSIINGLSNPEVERIIGIDRACSLREEIELVRCASYNFDSKDYLAGILTPVYFGSALTSFGVREMLDGFVENAPAPKHFNTPNRVVDPEETPFTGFVFKIQANMDPQHRDRIAFLRVCSGSYQPGIKVYHVRLGREMKISDALTFMADEREHAGISYPGDIIGIHNHGNIHIGDTFTQGEELQFTGVPNFAPELFRRACLKDPLKAKALQKGLDQLCEEGATQLFRPLNSNDLILGTVGILQFDVACFRLQREYGVDCNFENVKVATARWVSCSDAKRFEEFKSKLYDNLALDHHGQLVYIATSWVNLQLAQERWPEVCFTATREYSCNM
jgi:peptide chain release factor 3